jgi:hypothetical protein
MTLMREKILIIMDSYEIENLTPHMKILLVCSKTKK